MKIRPVGAEMFHEDEWTGMTELIIAFRNFANAPQTNGPQIPSTRHRWNKEFCVVIRQRIQRHKNHGCVISRNQTFVVQMSSMALGSKRPPFVWL